MPSRKYHVILTIILVIVVCANFLSVRSVHADGETPTEPPAPTQVATEPPTELPTEPPAESTPEPVESTPEPVEATATPLAEVLTEIPENTEIVVLDENGNSVPLASQEAAEITEIIDPMWCPEGVLPGDASCSTNFPTITALVNHMRNNVSSYDENGIIYFTSSAGGSLTLTDAGSSLGSGFDTIKNYNLTLQGGWDGVSTSMSGQTNFGTSPISIGTSTNPWVGNLTLNDFVFNSSSQVPLTVYTTTGDITLNNVDVNNQGNTRNTAFLNTSSGDIAVTNGTYDGNSSNSSGFSATTGGSITISDSSFTDNIRPSTNTANGATLSAPVITLTNVTATGNDGSGVFFTGSSLFIDGGIFNNNQRYGIELANPATTTIYIQSAPACTGNASGCSNGTFVDATPPTLILPSDITTPATGPASAVVTYSASATDNVDPTVPVTCLPASGSTFPVGTTTVSCSATDTAGNTALGSFQVTVVDTTVVVTPTPPAPPSTGSTPGTSASGSSNSQSNSSPLIIPVTGGKVIDLNCNSTFWAFGIKLSFMNLCDYQTTVDSVDVNGLPGALPNSYSFVMGLDLSILSENQAIEELPNGTGIQLDFPILGGSKDQFAVLHWNGEEWVEISQQISDDQDFYQVITTNQTGTFVLVQK